MANSSLNLTSLDFDTLKQNYKTFLQTQSVFKDYNFDGSNISVLLDVMSYNSYLNSFYLNMVASEMFLDSAQKIDSVVSHAKELNYVPRSASSSVANINLTFVTSGLTQGLTLPSGTLFSGSNSNGAYSFVTNQTYTFTSPNTVYSIANLQIYEGKYTTDAFIVDYSNETQRFLLSNKNIDINSLVITVSENNLQINTSFTSASTLYGLTQSSNVYFIQAAENSQYEILFGDGFLGRKPQNQALISANYRVVNGSDSNGVAKFSLATNLSTVNGGSVTLTNITTSSNSSGGSNSELIESIRFNAPRYFATQQRAVSSDDYSSLVLSKFGGTIDDVNVYGGQTLTNKQYGKVVICLKPKGTTIAPDYIKNQVQNYLTNYITLPTRTIISDPDYIYCGITANVQYDKTLTTKLPNELSSVVLAAITSYSTSNLQKFNKDLRYSKLVYAIDNSDISITSNSTELKIIKRISPLLNYANSFDLLFNNAGNVETTNPLIGYNPYTQFSDEPILSSSAFTYVDNNNISYPLSYFRDDNVGNIVVYTLISGKFTIINSSAGKINYSTGEVNLTSFKTSFYNNYISIYIVPMNKDIIVNKDKVLIIDPSDITINILDIVK